MSEQTTSTQPTAEQQLANVQAAVSRHVEALLDATNAVRDIPKIVVANQNLAAERNAAAAKVTELEAKVAELEERLANLAPKAVEA